MGASLIPSTIWGPGQVVPVIVGVIVGGGFGVVSRVGAVFPSMASMRLVTSGEPQPVV